ncbi:MAG: PAS domain-containing protein [bacterium]|nr:PAS domain-containing protein [bacterium]
MFDQHRPPSGDGPASAVLDALPILAWQLDVDATARSFNRRALDYLGRSPMPAVTRDWRAAVHPGDAPLLDAFLAALATSREPREMEARLRRHDGAYRWFLVRAARAEGGRGWWVAATDVDERRRTEDDLRASEQRSRRIIDRIPGWVCTMTGAGELELVNRRIADYFGLEREQLRDWGALVHPDERAGVLDAWTQAVRTGDPYETEHRLLGADGAYRWFLARGLPERAAAGAVVRWYVQLTDIEDRKRAEHALQARERELTASIAHEVNQPLAAVVNNAEVCQMLIAAPTPDVGEIGGALTDILRDARRASAIVARVRQLAMTAPFEPAVLDLRDVVADVLGLAGHETRSRRVRIEATLPDDAPLVRGDRVQLQQVLQNLILNGLDAVSQLPEPRRRLAIHVGRETIDGRPCVVTAVGDAGVGAGPATLARLFEPFYTTKTRGMGMGLAVSRSIVAAHGGDLWAEVNDGPGMTFSMRLPVVDASIGSRESR